MMVTPKEAEEVESSANGQTTAERRLPKPWVVLAILVAVSLVTLAASTACAGAGAPSVLAVSEMVWPEGIAGEVPGVRGDFELRLNIGQRGDVRFRARGRAEGPGIINHALYSMWLNNPGGAVVFIDAAPAREEITVDAVTGEVECEVGVDLRDDLAQAPFNATSIENLTATIREGPGSNRLMAQAPLRVSDLTGRVVLQFTFTEFELASLGVPRFGERQARFVPQGELSDDRRCIDRRFFEDPRDRDRRDREDRERRDREDQDPQDRERQDQEPRDRDRRDREDQESREREDQDPQDRERQDQEPRDRDRRDREDQERRDREDQDPQDRERQDQEPRDRDRRDQEDQERRLDDEEQRQDEERPGNTHHDEEEGQREDRERELDEEAATQAAEEAATRAAETPVP